MGRDGLGSVPGAVARQAEVVHMDMGAGRNLPLRYPDHLAVLAHARSSVDGAHRHLVPRRDVLKRGVHTFGGPHRRAPADVFADEPDVVDPGQRDQRYDNVRGFSLGHAASSRTAVNSAAWSEVVISI